MERVLRLVTECRSVLRALERPSEPGESSSAEAERILYYTLMSAIDAGLIKTMEDALQVLRHASQPLSDSEIGDSLDARQGTTRPGAGQEGMRDDQR